MSKKLLNASASVGQFESCAPHLFADVHALILRTPVAYVGVNLDPLVCGDLQRDQRPL